jgi:hypothetical protein
VLKEISGVVVVQYVSKRNRLKQEGRIRMTETKLSYGELENAILELIKANGEILEVSWEVEGRGGAVPYIAAIVDSEPFIVELNGPDSIDNTGVFDSYERLRDLVKDARDFSEEELLGLRAGGDSVHNIWKKILKNRLNQFNSDNYNPFPENVVEFLAKGIEAHAVEDKTDDEYEADWESKLALAALKVWQKEDTGTEEE